MDLSYRSNENNSSTSFRTFEELIPNLPKVQTINPKNLEEISQILGVTNTTEDYAELQSELKKQLIAFELAMRPSFSYPNEEWMPLIDILYNLYLLSKDNNLNIQWLNNLRTLDGMLDYFLGRDIDPVGIAHMIRNIEWFIKVYVHPYRHFRIFNEDSRVYSEPRIYLSDRKWVALPLTTLRKGEAIYTDAEIIDEIIELLTFPPPIGESYIHASGSAALEGIEIAQCLQSADEAIKSGIKIRTGEHVVRPSNLGINSAKGLPSIFASRGPDPREGYSLVRWFDESPIAFYIDEKKHREFQQTDSIDYQKWYEDEVRPTINNLGSEGIIIGPRVSLSSVSAIYCWKDYQETLKTWCARNAPHIRVLSYEAWQVMRDHAQSIYNIGIKKGLSFAETLEYIKRISLDAGI